MKFINYQKVTVAFLLLITMVSAPVGVYAQNEAQTIQDSVQVKEFKGVVTGADSGEELVFATITVEGTNISTITNAEGSFSLKVPLELAEGNVNISFLGYQTKTISLNKFTRNGNIISLSPAAIALEEVNVSSPKNALDLVRSMLGKRGDNYIDQPLKMTAFYRETIKKRRRDASLSEAVVTIYKQPNNVMRNDVLTLYKSRKSTNYDRLDTVAVKLQGGPFTPLYLDVMKYPQRVFTSDMFESYEFTFDQPTQINDRSVFVVNFKQKPEIIDPLYYGKLYIATDSHALVSAVFNLNVENRQLASEMLVRKKPARTDVYPTNAAYRVDYRIKDGKWYYGYSNVQLAIVVNKKGKLFNSKYYLNSEMAITDWKVNPDQERIRSKERLRPTVIIADEASGFSDPDFWGPYNVIEPEKSIESAIEKIQRQLEQDDNS